jgi:hypothetical protein
LTPTENFTELNAWLGDRCRALWDEVRHPEHDQFSVAEMLDNERPHLMPMPEPFDAHFGERDRPFRKRDRSEVGAGLRGEKCSDEVVLKG